MNAGSSEQRSKRTLVAFLIVSLLLAGCSTATRSPDRPGTSGLYDTAWEWTDDAGRAVRLQDLRGQTVVLSAIYTACAGTCPLTLGRMKTLAQTLREQGRRAHFVLVTLDPADDTPERLAAYRAQRRLDPAQWSLLRGDNDTTSAFARRLSMHRIVDSGHLLHVSRTLIIGTDGTLLRALDGRSPEEALAVIAESEAHAKPR